MANYTTNIPTSGTFTRIDHPIKKNAASTDSFVTYIDLIQFGQTSNFGYNHNGAYPISLTAFNNWPDALEAIHAYLDNINKRLEALENGSGDEPVEPTQYTVRFMNGTTTHYSVTGVEGTIIDMPNDPTKTGYRFVGWNTNSGAISAGTVATSIGTSDVTYYAIWTPNTYTVTLNITHGSITSGNRQQTVNYNSKATWTVTPDNGYDLPPTVTNGTILGSTVTSKAITSNTTVAVNCVQQQPQTTYYWYVGTTKPTSLNYNGVTTVSEYVDTEFTNPSTETKCYVYVLTNLDKTVNFYDPADPNDALVKQEDITTINGYKITYISDGTNPFKIAKGGTVIIRIS